MLSKKMSKTFGSALLMVAALCVLAIPSQAATWDTTRVYTGTAALYDVAVGDKLKGASDDTVRIFTTQNATPFNVLLFTDIALAPPMSWRTDIISTETVAMRGAAIGDPDRDGDNDLLFGRSSTVYQLKRSYWNGSAWTTELITGTPTAIYDIAVGDANNDGNADDIILATGNGALRVYWNGASWDTTRIYHGASTLYGVAIGDFDASNAGNEVVAVNYGQQVVRILWTGAAWQSTVLYTHGTDIDLYDVTVGDFDASNPGGEIAINNGYGMATHGAILELYGSGASWTLRALYTPATGWGGSGEIAVGDFLGSSPGAEIVAVSGGGTAYEARVIYGSGTSWSSEKLFGTAAAAYGIAVGNVNRHRAGLELAVTGNKSVWESEERVMADNMAVSAINNPANGAVFTAGTSVTVQATARNTATNSQTNVPVNLEISDGVSYTYTDVEYTGTLTQGQTELIAFSPDWTVPSGVAGYTIKVWTALAGDEYALDDTLRIGVTGIPSGYAVQGFEATTFPPEDWASGPVATDWARTSGNAHSGTYKAYARGQNAWLHTYQMNVGTGDQIRYWYRAESASYPTSFRVRLSSSANQMDTSAYTTILADHPNISSTTYQEGVVDLSPYKGRVYIAFQRYYGQVDYYYLFLDDVLMPPMYVPPGDMATISIDDVPGMVQTSTSTTMKATVQNQGGATAAAGVVVKLKIEGPESYVYTDQEVTTLDLDPGETEQIVFDPDWVAPEVLCNYTVTIWTELSGDESPANDTLSQIVNVYRAGGLAESFTGLTFPPPGWTVFNFWLTSADDAWSRYTVYYHTDPACARIYYDFPNNDWLITPRLQVQEGDKLKFWWRVQSTSYEETLFVRVSTDPDVSDTSAYSIIHTIISTNINWSLEVVDLSAYAGQDIYIAWHYPCDNNYGFAIDDVTGPYFPTQIAVSPDSVYEEPWPDSFFDVFMYVGNVGGGQLDYSIELESAVGWMSVAPTSGSALGGETDTVTLSFNTTGLDGHYYNTVRIISNSGEKQDGDTVEVPVHLWVRLIPGMDVAPDSFAVEVPGDGTLDEEMYVINTGSGPLDYEIETEEWGKLNAVYAGEPAYPDAGAYQQKFTDKTPEKGEREFNHGISPTKGMGGPDTYGYRWIDSDESGGPTFSWVEINSVGTAVSPTDDGNVGPFPIGFTFEFYGVEFTQFQIAANGFASFTSTSGSLTNYTIPTTGEPNNLLALMWDDLRTASGGGSGTIYYHSDGSRLVIEWDHVMRYGTTFYYTMQIILYPNGKIVYQYLTMDGTRLNESTIGIENGTGTDGLQVVYNANYVHNNMAIRFSAAPDWLVFDPEAGSVPLGQEDTVDVTFDATGLLSGEFYGAFIITGNDPDNPADTVPAHMTVLAPDMTVSPDSVITTGTEGAVHHETVNIGNTGPGDLLWSIDEDVDWLSASPSSGTVASGDPATAVDLTVDCTSLYAGDYLGLLTINNNDPDLYPSITYKVYLHVGPDPSIETDPDSFYIEVFAGTYRDSTLRLTNDGAGHLVFDIEIEETGIKQSLSEGFEGTWPPTGWSLIQTHTGTGQPFPSYWTQVDSLQHSGSYAAGLWWDYGHQDEWLISPSIGIAGVCSLTFWTYGWEGSTYGDHYWVKVSTDGGSNWDEVFDLTALTGNAWNEYNYPYHIDLSAYSGQTVKIAFHADDPPDNDGLWYIWVVDDIELTSYGGGWLSVIPEEGVVDPATYTDLTVRFDATNVLGGEKFGNIVINHNVPEDKGQTVVPVHMLVLGPEYSVDPESLIISALEGQYTDVHLYIGNMGGLAPLTFDLSDDFAWLDEIPSSGTVAIDDQEDVIVRVDGNQLIPGDYFAKIYVHTNDFDETYDTVKVYVHVGPDPVIRVKPEAFLVEMFPGTVKDSILTIVNDGGGTLAWEITVEDVTPLGAAYTGAQSEADDPLVDQSSPMHLTRNAGGSTPEGSPLWGKGEDTLFVQLPHDPDDSWSFATTDIGAGYKLYENFWGLTEQITDIDFWGLCLINTGSWYAGDPNSLVFDITFYSDPPDDPTLPPTEVVCTYTDVLPATIVGTGTYFAGFQMWFFDGAELPTPCELTEGWVSIQSKSTGSGDDWLLWASAKTGDGFSYQENGTNPRYFDQAMILTGSAAAGWLVVSPDSGLTSPHDSTDVDVTFDATDLAGGTWFANIIIDHNAPEDKGQTIVPVRLSLLGCNFAMTPESLVVDMLEGEIVNEHLYISNPGGEGDLIFSMTDPVAWLAEFPDAGSVAPDAQEDVLVRVDASGLYAGNYYSEITITTNDFNNLEVTVPVYVHVGPDPDIEVGSSVAAGVIPGCEYSIPWNIANVGGGHLAYEISVGQNPPVLGGSSEIRQALEDLQKAGNANAELTPSEAYKSVSGQRSNVELIGGSSEGLLIHFGKGKTADILLVDDDGGLPGGTYFDIEDIYTDALDAGGYAYDYYVVDWTVPTSDGPPLATLQQYAAVIWFTGETWGYYGRDVLTVNDEAHLAAYLGGGGGLFLSAGDYLYNAYPSAGSFSAGQFPYDYLHLASVTQDAVNDPFTVTGGTGSVADGMQFDCLRFTDNPDVPLWPDYLVTRSSAALNVFNYSGHALTIQYDSGTWKVVFSTLEFAGLVDGSPSYRSQFMASVVDWLVGGGCPFTVTPESGVIGPEATENLTLTFDGNAFAECVDETLTCYLAISSNDPDEPVVGVELNMYPGRGDVTAPACLIELGDPVFLVNYVLKGGPAPDPVCMGDCDPSHDGLVDMADVIYLLQYLYQGGMPPAATPQIQQPTTIKQPLQKAPAPKQMENK